MAKTYDYIEIKLQDFEADGMPLSVLQVGAEFSLCEGWPPRGTDPGEPGELELGQVTVLKATTGDGMWEASEFCLGKLTKALRADREAMGRLEEQIGLTLD